MSNSNAFQEYPKTLRHPSERAAVLGREYQEGRPAMFPPVTVHNRDQEEQYVSKGYEPAGSQNPAAFLRATIAPIEDDYEYHEYPKWVNGVLVKDPNEAPLVNTSEYPKYYGNVLVHTREQEDEYREEDRRAALIAAGKDPDEKEAPKSPAFVTTAIRVAPKPTTMRVPSLEEFEH